jgi:hypothetical protein
MRPVQAFDDRHPASDKVTRPAERLLDLKHLHAELSASLECLLDIHPDPVITWHCTAYRCGTELDARNQPIDPREFGHSPVRVLDVLGRYDVDVVPQLAQRVAHYACVGDHPVACACGRQRLRE